MRGWTSPYSATFILDIADDEGTSSASSSPWAGWVGWLEDQIVIGWVNNEVGTIGSVARTLSSEIEEEPTADQWGELALIVIASCFEN